MSPHRKLREPLARRRPFMYGSLILANIGALGYTLTELDTERDWYSGILSVIGTLCTVGAIAFVAGAHMRWSEEMLFLNGAWFFAVAVLVELQHEWKYDGWGPGVVMMAAGFAVWGLWIDLRAERQQGVPMKVVADE